MRVPSKKVSLWILGAIFVVTVIISVSVYIEKTKNKSNVLGGTTDNFEIQVAIETETQVDSDGDGLLDWEESLWSTDPNNPDSDGDGTTDGEEVAQSRNPNLAGPEDSQDDFYAQVLAELEKNPVDPSTLTGKLSLDFAEEYFNLLASGGLTDQSKNNLISSFVNGAVEGSITPAVYNSSMVTTFDPSDKEKLAEYYNNWVRENTNLSDNLENPINSLLTETAVQNIIKSSENLIRMETPQPFLDLQVELANNYHKLALAVRVLDKDTNDPLLSLIGLNDFQSSTRRIAEINETTRLYRIENGIIYDEEAGSFRPEN